MSNPIKQRYDRAAQAKHRGSKTSYRTQIENLQILLAWEAVELTEGQAAKALGVSRIEARTLRAEAMEAGGTIADQIIGSQRAAASN